MRTEKRPDWMNSKPLERGVYRRRELSEEGWVYLIGVDWSGRRLIERKIYPFEEPNVVLREVEAKLDELDPRPGSVDQ